MWGEIKKDPLGYAIGFAFVIGLAVLSWQSHQPPVRHSQHPAQTDYQDTRASQALADPVAEKQEPKRERKNNWYDTFMDHAPDWFVAIFTGLLVYVTYRLVKSTNLMVGSRRAPN